MKRFTREKKWRLVVVLAVAALLSARGGGGFATTESTSESGYDNGAYMAAKSAPADSAGGVYEDSYLAEFDDASQVQEAAAADEGAGAAGGGAAEPLAETTGKKLIKNVDLEVETQQYDELVANIQTEVASLGGYVENFTASDYNQGRTRNSYLTVRVPAEHLDGFVNRVAEKSNILYRNERVEDVTLQYVDLDTHKKALVTERDRLLELLEKAENVADIIEIESRLSEVRYQIESLESQLRAIDNQVTYSTVYITIQEVEVLTPVAEKSVWQKISDGFGYNVYRVIWGLEDFAIGCVINLPFLFVWIVVIAALFVVGRLFWKGHCRRREKRRKKAAEQQALEAEYEEIPLEKDAGTPEGAGGEDAGEKQNEGTV